MIEIKELRALRGPNRYTRNSAIFMVLDIKEFETQPSDKIDGFSDRLLSLIPTLQEHGCSIGGPGGFVKRLLDGTWAGHIIEHIAIELQCLAGMEVKYGKTFTQDEHGIYIVCFRYLVESVGIQAAKDAVSIFEALSKDSTVDITSIVSNLKVLRENDMLGPSTWSIVKEAKSRGIPYIRLNDQSYVQLGYGSTQKRIQASMTGQTSAIAVEAADEKTNAKMYLGKSGIPVPKGQMVSSLEGAIEAFRQLRTAVVVKPDIGNHGKGSTMNIIDEDQLKIAFEVAHQKHPNVIVEEFIEGEDYRLLVINGVLAAAAKREPAHVTGNGESSIKDLVEQINIDPRRGFGHEKILTRIDLDDMTLRILDRHDFSLDSIPAQGEKVYLKATANLSQGGTATDVTDIVSPSIRRMAERAAKIIGLDCVGIDILARDISLPLEKSGAKVVEVNAAPGFRMHLEPTHGKSRNVAKPLVDMLFPDSYTPVPILAVTGTNGKTTTCKLISHALKYAGKHVGLTCTTGVEIDGCSILEGDYSGPEGAGIVLREPTVDHIVLEVARGGIARRGLGTDEIDVGVLLNIGTDHLGSDWIKTQEDLCLTKSTVVEVVKESGSSVLNADDELTMSVLERARGNIILFSIKPELAVLRSHIANGGTVVTIENKNIVIKNNILDVFVCPINTVPITLGGLIDFNISNALAAVAALSGLKLSVEQIRNGITTFYSTANQNPGRMNLLDFQKYKVLIDYGHNSESVRALGEMLPRLSEGRKVALCHGTGSRTDQQIIDFGTSLATVYDYILLTDFDPRHRAEGETIKLVKKGLAKGGFSEKNVEVVADPEMATDALFSRAKDGDLLVIQISDLEPIMSQVMEKHQDLIERTRALN